MPIHLLIIIDLFFFTGDRAIEKQGFREIAHGKHSCMSLGYCEQFKPFLNFNREWGHARHIFELDARQEMFLAAKI